MSIPLMKLDQAMSLLQLNRSDELGLVSVREPLRKITLLDVEESIEDHKLALDNLAKASPKIMGGTQWSHLRHIQAWETVLVLIK